MPIPSILPLALVLFLTHPFIIEAEAASRMKEIDVGDHGYVITVPDTWTERSAGNEESIKVHLVDPGGKTPGHFTVHVVARNGRYLDEWVDHHLKVNFPRVHGYCLVNHKEDLALGSYDGKLIHASHMERHAKYDLCEAIVLTDSHILTFSWLHGFEPERAGAMMTEILGTFHTRSPADYCGRPYYEEGRALGFEDFGLFLRLPRGWMPGPVADGSATVTLPGGTMKAIVFKRVRKGIEGLKKLVAEAVPRFPEAAKHETVTFGKASHEAFFTRIPARDGEPSLEAFLGLHDRGGYAILLESGTEDERDIFRRVASESVLLEANKVKRRFRLETTRLRKVFRSEDLSGLCPPLTLLSFFSESEAAAKTIGEGLGSRNPVIRRECVNALGRMGNVEATELLSAILDEDGLPELKIACVRSLGRIGGTRQKDILIRYLEKLEAVEGERELTTLLEDTIRRIPVR